MGLRVERKGLREGMREFREKLGGIADRVTVDLGPWLQESLEDARDEIINRTLNDQRDTNGKPFTPLALSTIQKKRMRTATPNVILRERGYMTEPDAFRITRGNTAASLIHRAPYGSHTWYPKSHLTRSGKVRKRTKSGKPRMRHYDYGLAHQFSKRAVLPQRKWWLEPGTAMFGAWMKRIAESLKQWAWRGTRWK